MRDSPFREHLIVAEMMGEDPPVQTKGVIPVPPDYEAALMFDFVDWDGMTMESGGKPVWTFFKSGADAIQMIEPYGSTLTAEQMGLLK